MSELIVAEDDAMAFVPELLAMIRGINSLMALAETWRQVWGEGKHFRKKIPFYGLFLVINSILSVFSLSLLSEI